MLANLDRQKFIEMLGKLGSEKDEDALSAARDLHAQLTVAQLSWDDLLVPDQANVPVAASVGGDESGDDDGDYEGDLPDSDDSDDEDDDERDLTDEEKSEAVSLIDKISTLEISKDTKEEIAGYKQDIDDGDFAQMDLRYLRAFYTRLVK